MQIECHQIVFNAFLSGQRRRLAVPACMHVVLMVCYINKICDHVSIKSNAAVLITGFTSAPCVILTLSCP